MTSAPIDVPKVGPSHPNPPNSTVLVVSKGAAAVTTDQFLANNLPTLWRSQLAARRRRSRKSFHLARTEGDDFHITSALSRGRGVGLNMTKEREVEWI